VPYEELNCCYYRYQQFWHISETNGSFSNVLTHKPFLYPALKKGSFAHRLNYAVTSILPFSDTIVNFLLRFPEDITGWLKNRSDVRLNRRSIRGRINLFRIFSSSKRNNCQKVSGFSYISRTFACFTSETEASGRIICFPSRDKTNLRYYVKSIWAQMSFSKI